MSTSLFVVEKYFTALAEGRVPDAMCMLALTVKWHQPGANQFSGVHVGPESVEALIGGMMSVSEGTFKVVPTGPLMGNGQIVAVPVHFSGKRDGEQLDQAGVDMFRVEDELIVEVYLFSSDGPAEDRFWGR